MYHFQDFLSNYPFLLLQERKSLNGSVPESQNVPLEILFQQLPIIIAQFVQEKKLLNMPTNLQAVFFHCPLQGIHNLPAYENAQIN